MNHTIILQLPSESEPRKIALDPFTTLSEAKSAGEKLQEACGSAAKVSIFTSRGTRWSLRNWRWVHDTGRVG